MPARNDTWRLPCSSHAAVQAAFGKSIPKWTPYSFMSDGQRLIVAIERIAKVTQRKAIPVVARRAHAVFKLQAEMFIERIKSRFGLKAIEIHLPQNEDLWVSVLNEVFEETGTKLRASVLPPVTSVAAQGYSKMNEMLGYTGHPDTSNRLAAEASNIAGRITKINEHTRELFKNTIQRAIKDGLTAPETSKLLQDKLPQYAASRMFTIARTELNHAWTLGAIESFKESGGITHISVIGCESIEPEGPLYNGIPTCNIQDVPIYDAHKLEFHPNHTGNIVPSRFNDV